MSDLSAQFKSAFEALTGNTPLSWQTRLFDEFKKPTDQWPAVIDLPTGLGKTSVIPIWLIALASSSCLGGALPRRLVYIVNRRTVVDQATKVVEDMRERLHNPRNAQCRQHEAVLNDLVVRLCGLSASAGQDVPLGVSTLRGELADNEDWKADPARPAIIIGTIDMIGSKLLFSGYGDGRYGRAHHAGLIGQDSLIVHDEAHLTPAFSELLRGIADEQEPDKESRRVHVMELSATQRGSDGPAFRLRPEDETDEQTGRVVKQRLDAKKWLRLHKCDDVIGGLVERAKSHTNSPAKVLIYARSPKDAQKVAEAIRQELGEAADQRVALLTGTIRGHERDRLVSQSPVYRALLDPDVPVAHSVFLVSTSAGEVGIDIDADHMVCDLTTLDSLLQRLGRVNRRGGEGREARVDVVWMDKEVKGAEKPTEKPVAATLGILRKWAEGNGGSDSLLVSPRSLQTLVQGLNVQEREEAFSLKPATAPLTDILLDNWSLTSVDEMPGRPEVAAYLHGLTPDPPETYVAWRKEVTVLHEAGLDESSLCDWFHACRIEARERLRDRTDHIKKGLDALLKAHRKKDSLRDFPVVLLDERARAAWAQLSEVAADESRLRFRTLVLPAEAGGLDKHGMLDGKAAEPIGDIDVAEHDSKGSRRERWRHVRMSDGQSQWRRLLSDETAEPLSGLRERERVCLREAQEEAEDEGDSIDLVLLESPGESAAENPETVPFQQTLADHTQTIVKHMEAIADRLGLEPTIRDALVAAARLHDHGKDRAAWQRFACNRNFFNAKPPGPALAKSEKYLHGRALGGYRHEFGSLLEALDDGELAKHPERDLVLHLIAAHHGWARPHFEPCAFDHEGPRDARTRERCPPTSADNEAALVETMQLFGRLQQRCGRWGLAWLESLLRCADIAASKQAMVSPNASVSSGESVPEEVGA